VSSEVWASAGEHRVTGYDVSTLAPRQNYKLLCGAVVPRPIACSDEVHHGTGLAFHQIRGRRETVPHQAHAWRGGVLEPVLR
jgi:hypothetical protein